MILSMQTKFREQLTTERQKILDALDTGLEAEKPVILDQQSVGRLSRMDALQNQSMAKAIATNRKARILRIDAALARIKEGTFGFCVDCGEEIVPKRLENDPSHPRCLDCAQG